jgi:hypothetical protein
MAERSLFQITKEGLYEDLIHMLDKWRLVKQIIHIVDKTTEYLLLPAIILPQEGPYLQGGRFDVI